jgi:nitrogenase subunit NifH
LSAPIKNVRHFFKDKAIMYDIIGDIHGYTTPLKNLLAKLGYIIVDEVGNTLKEQPYFWVTL